MSMNENSGLLHLELCAPERSAITMDVQEVIVPGAAGVFTVLPGHTPVLGTLDVGVLIAYDAKGQEHFMSVNGGFAEVASDKVLVLTQTAERSEEVDEKRAEQARERAEERLKSKDPNIDERRAELALKRAMSRIHARRGIGY